MQFQFDVASNSAAVLPPLPVAGAETVPELLRQILQVQREHLNHARATSHDNLARWRNLLSRWQNDQPEFADHCKSAYPLLEKSYVQMLAGMVKELSEQGDDALDKLQRPFTGGELELAAYACARLRSA